MALSVLRIQQHASAAGVDPRFSNLSITNLALDQLSYATAAISLKVVYYTFAFVYFIV